MACYIFQSCFNCRADENFPCSIANAFNRGWEQFLLQSAHGFQHPTQLQRVPPSPFCPCLMWEGCFLTGLGMVKGWWEKHQQLLEKIRDAPTSLLAALSVSNCKAMGPEQLPPTCPGHSLGTKAAGKEDVNPFHPLHTPASRAALTPVPSASALTDTWANSTPLRAPVEN